MGYSLVGSRRIVELRLVDFREVRAQNAVLAVEEFRVAGFAILHRYLADEAVGGEVAVEDGASRARVLLPEVVEYLCT